MAKRKSWELPFGSADGTLPTAGDNGSYPPARTRHTFPTPAEPVLIYDPEIDGHVPAAVRPEMPGAVLVLKKVGGKVVQSVEYPHGRPADGIHLNNPRPQDDVLLIYGD